MNICYTEEEYKSCSPQNTLPLKCSNCDNQFQVQKKLITYELKSQKGERRFCSRACAKAFNNKKYDSKYQAVSCLKCNKQFQKKSSEIAKSKNNFCSKSCSAIYRNANKTHGTRRSKLEVWLEEQLPSLYPSLEFHFNRKDTINSELDIYIPSLKLAFELNGLFHYEPIFGPEKLAQIQNNDQRKHQACNERGIELCLIDASSLVYFKPEGAKKYLSIVTSIIDQKSK